MSVSIEQALVVSFLVLAPGLAAQVQPRRPRGVYAVADTQSEINQQQQNNPSITPAQLSAYFNALYQDLLSNPAIAGLTLQVHWDTLNPNPPTAANAYDWSVVDEAFAQAAAWDAQNPGQPPKTVQLIVTPGFNSPQWLLNQIPLCDGLFETPVETPPSTCGAVTFTGYQESGDGTVLPLPWNPVYKSAWQAFVTALAARYESNPAFVSIAVAGPTAASAEMTTASNSTTPAQTQFGGIQANDMWRQLFALQYPGMAAYQSTDQAFIDEWNNAIDLYGQVFSGVTLVATTGSGFPNFNQNYTVPPAFSALCPNPNMQCAAVATILFHFAQSSVGGANAKATQTSGMEASRAITAGNLGVAGGKWLSQSTAQLTSPATQILGGDQFNTSFSGDTLAEGCTSTFPPNASDTPAGCSIPSSCTTNGCVPVACIPQACLTPGVTPASLASYNTFKNVPNSDLIPPEQAEYNVLNVYFDGTPVATSFGGTQGAAPLNYLQIYAPDIQYAAKNVNAPAQVVEANGTVSTTAQALLNLASQSLLTIAEPSIPAAASANPAAGSGTSGTFTFTFSDSAGFQSLTVLDVLINSALDGRAACYVAFVPSGPSAGSVYLVDNAGDAGGPYSGMVLPGSQSVSNSQCIVKGAGSSVSSGGNSITLTLAITFAAGFAGNQVFYLSAQDATGNSGWQVQGTWNVPGLPAVGPAVSGMSPARTSALSQTYTFTFSDTKGWQDISVANILINSSIDGRHGCYVAFVPASSSVLLVDDAGDAGGPYSGMVLPSSGSVSNSQCTIAGGGSTITTSGDMLTLNLAITFSQSFAGTQIFYLSARNSSGQDSGWQAAGTNTVP